METQEEIQEVIEKRLQGLCLDDKRYDEFRVDETLDRIEQSPDGDAREGNSLLRRDAIRVPHDDKKDDEQDKTTPSSAPNLCEIPQAPATLSQPIQEPPPLDPPVDDCESEPTSISTRPCEQSPTIGHRQPLFRFRRPVLNDDETESYETLTMSEVQLMDSEVELALQLSYEELRLALGDFDEMDEFEEIDEFEDEWEERAVGEGDWDVEGDVYCGGADCGEDFLDDRN